MMSSHKSMNNFEPLKRMKKFGNKLGKIISIGTRKKEVHVKNSSSGFAQILENKHDNVACPIAPIAFKNQNGESSNYESSSTNDPGSTLVCGICLAPHYLEDSFYVEGCEHFYCRQCIVKFVVSNLQNNVTSMACPEPGCRGVLNPGHCRPILPNDIFVRWVRVLFDQNEQSSNPGRNSSSTDSLKSCTDESSTFICDICVAPIHLEDSLDIKGCDHFYCRQCIVDFILSKLQENVVFIMCPEPGCRGVLDPEYCYPIIPNEVFDLWVHALWDQNEQSSNSEINNASTFICDFCVEPIRLEDSFNVKGCSHFYCQQCIVNFVVSKLQDNVTSIECPEPNCRGVLDPEYCRPILPNDVFDRWGKALVENLITGSETLKPFYCPFKDCSAMLIDDGNEVIQQSECPYCRKLFCAQCKVPWHAEIDCTEFQKMNEGEREREDIMLRNLAQKKKWRRCPSCKYYVAKKSGCSYIKCRS